jgi:hypothetical protein
MEQNPYAPPKAPVSDVTTGDGRPVASEVPLYSPNQVGVAAFLASAFAGAWLMAANFRALGQPVKARNALWAGLGATILTIALGFILPDKFPNVVLPLGVTFAIRAMAERYFTAELKEHLDAGGEQRSWWRVVGISLLIVTVLFGVALLGVFGYYLVVGVPS